MDIILRESQRLDQAIRDFLTFARPGKFAPAKIPGSTSTKAPTGGAVR